MDQEELDKTPEEYQQELLKESSQKLESLAEQIINFLRTMPVGALYLKGGEEFFSGGTMLSETLKEYAQAAETEPKDPELTSSD